MKRKFSVGIPLGILFLLYGVCDKHNSLVDTVVLDAGVVTAYITKDVPKISELLENSFFWWKINRLIGCFIQISSTPLVILIFN